MLIKLISSLGLFLNCGVIHFNPDSFLFISFASIANSKLIFSNSWNLRSSLNLIWYLNVEKKQIEKRIRHAIFLNLKLLLLTSMCEKAHKIGIIKNLIR